MNNSNPNTQYPTHCDCCRESFESLGVTPSDQHSIDDTYFFCSAECQLEAERGDIEQEELDYLAGDWW
jgi:hypothetical protein